MTLMMAMYNVFSELVAGLMRAEGVYASGHGLDWSWCLAQHDLGFSIYDPSSALSVMPSLGHVTLASPSIAVEVARCDLYVLPYCTGKLYLV